MTYRVGYMGWLGHKNIGDEACFEAIKSLLPKSINWLPWDARGWNYGKLPNLCVLGGGTIFDIRLDRRGKGLLSMLKNNVPVVIWGTGVMPLTAPKRPIKSKMHNGSLHVLKASKFVGVRGPISKYNLDISGFTASTVVGDPAIILGEENNAFLHDSHKIAINIGNTHKNLFGSEEHTINEAVNLSRKLVERGYNVELFAVWPKDLPFLQAVANKVPAVNIRKWDLSTGNLINYFKSCRCVVGLKLHSVVLSAASGVPFVSWAYREKCFDFVKSVNLKNWAIRSDDKNLAEKSYKLILSLSKYGDIVVNRLNNKKGMFLEQHKMIAKKVMEILSEN